MRAPAPDNRRGALLLVLAAFLFTAEVAGVRALEGRASDGQIMFARGFSQFLLLAPVVASRGLRALATRRADLHLVRGLVSLLCWWLYYRSFQTLDLSLATTLTFSTSLFVVLLAAPILGERVGLRRWLTTIAGFGGVAVAAGVVDARLEPGVLIGLGAAAAGAALVFLNRLLSRTEPTLAIMVWIAVVTSLGALPLAVLDWRALAPADLGLLLLSGALGTCGMFLTIEAYRVGEVSALAPFPYVRLLLAAAAGWALFGETPGLNVAIGGAIVIVCALAASAGERRRALPAPQR